MEWFAFLIYFLIAALCTLVVWFTIKVGFRVSTLSEPVLTDPMELNASQAGLADQTRRLYWNFAATLIVVPTLLLVLGIAVQTAPLKQPITGTLAIALVLIWCMSFWSGMLSFPSRVPADHPSQRPDESELAKTELELTQRSTVTKETP
ncbi:hypothetical protein [uncultured Gimesia sp.]|uniref:hypothetical protein n=1 Tax=uncultured Gimesia sp. TaxID=1678688 RepID=UPI002626734A|nr:hypothetical protein [uncultured Gimesia sp.]